MKVILLERVEKLGFIGDVVEVRSGYARNFLLPKAKALRATVANLEYFASKKADIEANNLRLKSDAEKVRDKMSDISLIAVRQASESGFLFGSVRTSDVCSLLSEKGFNLSKNQVKINTPIKTVGHHVVTIILHPEVSIDIPVRVMTAQELGNPVDQPLAAEESAASQSTEG